MASTMIKFPDGRTETKKVTTAYKVAGGVEYFVVDTNGIDNENKVFGVSFKPANEERFQKIVDMEEWKKAKGILVDDLHDKKDTFEHILLPEEILVTEDYTHNIALRDENYQKIEANYEEFLQQQNVVKAEPEINPFVTQEIVSPQIEEKEETIAEMPQVPIVDAIAPAPISVIPEETESVNNITEFPNIQNTNIVEEQPVLDTSNVVSMDIPTSEEKQSGSVVSESYVSIANQLIEQVREVTNKYIQNMEEMKDEIGRQLEEAYKINELSKQTFDKSQQILTAQNEESLTKDLTKAA